jgi:periplasmic copper chaperone A
MKRAVELFLVGAAISLPATIASAHIGVSQGFANTTHEVTFSVGHGCSGLDTSSVKIDIPASVTGLRTLTSDFGKATVETDATGAVTSVTWQKPDQDLLPADTAFYKLVLRFRVPNTPFATLFFPTHQTCKGLDGGVLVSDWIGTMPAPPDGGGPEPAPEMIIVPARTPGWNKWTVPVAVTDLKKFFGDALIVWKDDAAYSANANTAVLIGTTAGVTALTSLAANDEIWVKY